MSREKKFRMWDKENKVMISGDDLAFEEYLPIKELLSGKNIMQFTGLKGKNGVEIYEGDIYVPRYNGFGPIEVKYYKGKYNVAAYMVESCEVIGNIHEHPDLLVQK